nr:immunoglobulin light chain junction region [Macaca mulatta]MOW28018.1 immunoglobulin light chain junction region [Macaca mulatta]MOW28941.1 immunoglobulin light chain junction region [Macaca mulatta]MOW29407.1 immunoglobulin light chain junction region [Macaca mulatta]MOW29555.1 immunoglobulin light chain junction region [Macaca mulatta]
DYHCQSYDSNLSGHVLF